MGGRELSDIEKVVLTKRRQLKAEGEVDGTKRRLPSRRVKWIEPQKGDRKNDRCRMTPKGLS